MRARSEFTRLWSTWELPEPEFEQKQVGAAVVRVTLRNNQAARQTWVDADVSTIIGVGARRNLSDIERRAINFAVEHNKKIKTTEAMKLMTRPRWGSAKKLLDGLQEKGILRFVSRYPRDPVAHYFLDVKPVIAPRQN